MHKGVPLAGLRLNPKNLMRIIPTKGINMNITVNRKPHTFDGAEISLVSVLESCAIPTKGIAVALNNHVVRKSDWQTTMLHDGDSITVIQAVCGG